SEPAWDFIKRQIDDSDFYILIVAARYGSIHPGTGLSYTEMEYDHASSKEVPVLAFIHGDPGRIHDKRRDQDQASREKLLAFRKKVQDSKLCKMWTTLDELDARVAKTIVAAKDHYKPEGFVRASLAVDHKKMADLLERNIELEEKLKVLQGDNPKTYFAHGKKLKTFGFEIEGPAEVIKELLDIKVISVMDDHDIWPIDSKCYGFELTWEELLWFTGTALLSGCKASDIAMCVSHAVRVKMLAMKITRGPSKIKLLRISTASFRLNEIIAQFCALEFIENTFIQKNSMNASDEGSVEFLPVWKLTRSGIKEFSSLIADKA
ncbi:MAG: DUF4062 domain-containing protein, partial [Tagaea sp.]